MIGHEARLTEAGSTRVQRLAAAFVLVSAAAAAAGFFTERHRFALAYHVGFLFVATIGLGALFFVMLHHLTGAVWSVVARRHMEWVAAVLPVLPLLFIPVALLAKEIFPWMAPHASDLAAPNTVYLDPRAFFLRACAYLLVWMSLAGFFVGQSRLQDTRRDDACSARMRAASGPAMVLFAITVTFAAIDWIMSLLPAWHSTIFGVYVFAGSVAGALAVLALLTIAIQRTDTVWDVSHVEHRHLVAKLLFAFVVFWAYLAFSQYLLIGYANLPDETLFFRLRWGNGWQTVSVLLVLAHFVLPFALLLPRAAKRSPAVLAASATLVLVGHLTDVYWLVMPMLPGQPAPLGIADAGALLAVSIAVLVVVRQVARGPLAPAFDPKLTASAQIANP